jgi:hypothetical protein
LVWILGEYAEKISNAEELIGGFLDTFADEKAEVSDDAFRETILFDKYLLRFNCKP